MATEISVLRFASVPLEVIAPVNAHARGCHMCRQAAGLFGWRVDTRFCPIAVDLVDRAIIYFGSTPEGR